MKIASFYLSFWAQSVSYSILGKNLSVLNDPEQISNALFPTTLKILRCNWLVLKYFLWLVISSLTCISNGNPANVNVLLAIQLYSSTHTHLLVILEANNGHCYSVNDTILIRSQTVHLKQQEENSHWSQRLFCHECRMLLLYPVICDQLALLHGLFFILSLYWPCFLCILFRFVFSRSVMTTILFSELRIIWTFQNIHGKMKLNDVYFDIKKFETHTPFSSPYTIFLMFQKTVCMGFNILLHQNNRIF